MFLLILQKSAQPSDFAQFGPSNNILTLILKFIMIVK